MNKVWIPGGQRREKTMNMDETWMKECQWDESDLIGLRKCVFSPPHLRKGKKRITSDGCLTCLVCCMEGSSLKLGNIR